MPENDEQDKGKGEDSLTSYEAKPGLGARITKTTTDGHGRKRRQRRREESSRVLITDVESQLTNKIEGRPQV